MPGGLENPLVGYAALTALKFTGYTLAAWGLNRAYPAHARNIIAVGATRTAIGMVFGYGIAVFLLLLLFIGTPALVLGYLAFIPVRLLEWWLIIFIFYDRQLQTRTKDWRCVGLSTVWSFVLDVPAIIGLVATAGYWIC